MLFSFFADFLDYASGRGRRRPYYEVLDVRVAALARVRYICRYV
jgi:hypothetical protein